MSGWWAAPGDRPQVVDAEIVDNGAPVTPASGDVIDAEVVDAEVVDAEVVDAEVVDVSPQLTAPLELAPGPDADPQPAAGGPIDFTDPVEENPPIPDPTGDPVAQHDQHDQHDTGDPMATVHPIRGDQTMTSTTSTSTTGPSMTEINGETLDPHAALTFVTGLKDLADSVVGQLELSVSSLSGRGVAGEPVELLTAMQEAFTTASGQCDTAKSHFERHIATQDVVLGDDTLAGTVEGTYVGSAS